MEDRTKASDAAGTSGGGGADDERPAAGPHAKPELTDDSRTPGAGTLPDTDSQDGEGDVGDGASS
ncbi:hypothetical protein ASG43_18430 [Aureimonas sp. Leaf454]|nr:hypothetical protein ASG43_18430 [Aureimonas sp. Leaf454]